MAHLRMLLVGLVALALTMSACAGAGENDLLAEIESRGAMRSAAHPDYANQSFLEGNGAFVGFDIDVATEIARRLGVAAEFVAIDNFNTLTSGSWGDQWDLSVTSMTVTTARQEVLDFAEPAYYYTAAQFGAAEGAGIESLADIDGQMVCVAGSTTYALWLAGDFETLGLPESSYFVDPPADVDVVSMATSQDCIEAIQAGSAEFQVFLTTDTIVKAAVDSGMPVYPVGSPVFSENLAVAFDKSSSPDDSRLVERVGEIIAEMRADGTLRELSLKWFEADLTQDPTQ